MTKFLAGIFLLAVVSAFAQEGVLKTFQTPFYQQIDKILVSPDGKTVIASDISGYVFFWSIEDAALTNILRAHTERISDLSISPDGKYFATTAGGTEINIWDFRSTVQVTKVQTKEPCLALSFSETGDALYFASTKGIYRSRIEDFKNPAKIYEAPSIDASYSTEKSGVFAIHETPKLLLYNAEAGKSHVVSEIEKPVSVATNDGLIVVHVSSSELILFEQKKNSFAKGSPVSVMQGVMNIPAIVSKENIIFIDNGNSANTWNAATGGIAKAKGLPTNLTSVYYNGQNLFTGNTTGEVALCKIPETASKTKNVQNEKVEVKMEPSGSVEGRPVQIRESAEVSSSTFEILVWDDENVDGDTISLSFNGQLILDRYMVTAEKKKIQITMDPARDNVLVMYAHNLGKNPPNTAAISINDGTTTRTLTLKSDLKKCDAVKFKLKQ